MYNKWPTHSTISGIKSKEFYLINMRKRKKGREVPVEEINVLQVGR